MIETKMTGLDRMLYMHSTADSSGSASVELTFAPGTDPDLAWAKVQNKLQLALPSLRTWCRAVGHGQQVTRNYLLIIASRPRTEHGPGRPERLRRVADRVPALARSGVGEVEMFGTGYSMRIWLDPTGSPSSG